MSLPSSRVGVCWSLRALLGTWLAPVIATGAAALRVPPWLAIATGIVVASALAGWGGRRIEVIVVRASRPVLLVAAVLALAAIAQMVRLSVFMIDARRADLSAAPGDPFRREHCCFTAYVEAERFARERGPNIYDSALYDGRHIGPLKVDAFHYPPLFCWRRGRCGRRRAIFPTPAPSGSPCRRSC